MPASKARLLPPLLALACPFELMAPWFRTGRATRSGYAFLRAANGAGISGALPVHLVELAVLSLPALAGAAWAATVLGSRHGGCLAASVAGAVLALLSGVLLYHSAGGGPIGPWAGLALGIGALLSSGGRPSYRGRLSLQNRW